MTPAIELEVQILRRRLTRGLLALGAVAMIAVAALGWSFSLGQAAARRAERLQRVTAGVDRLGHATANQRERMDPLERRLETFGTLEGRVNAELRSKADRSALALVRAQLRAIVDNVARSDSLLALLHRELGRRTNELAAASADSLAALRRVLDTELARIRREGRRQQLLALGLRVENLDEARPRSRAGTPLCDGAPLVNTGLVLAHIFGS